MQVVMGLFLMNFLTNALSGHHWLYQVAHVLHCDISLKNLMYCEKNGEVCGVLNDYDLAVCLDHNDSRMPSSKQRTGTKPYMAIDLLDPNNPPSRHLYRHDLESLIYVITAHTMRYKGTELMKNPPLQNWFTSNMAQLRASKKESITSSRPPIPSPEFSAFRSWLVLMWGTLNQGIRAQNIHMDQKLWVQHYSEHLPNFGDGESSATFNEETLGGHLTYEMLDEIMARGVA
jgi:serine/threonine protein kinase